MAWERKLPSSLTHTLFKIVVYSKETPTLVQSKGEGRRNGKMGTLNELINENVTSNQIENSN